MPHYWCPITLFFFVFVRHIKNIFGDRISILLPLSRLSYSVDARVSAPDPEIIGSLLGRAFLIESGKNGLEGICTAGLQAGGVPWPSLINCSPIWNVTACASSCASPVHVRLLFIIRLCFPLRRRVYKCDILSLTWKFCARNPTATKDIIILKCCHQIRTDTVDACGIEGGPGKSLLHFNVACPFASPFQRYKLTLDPVTASPYDA